MFKATFRGRELLYPQPFGSVTSGADKDCPVEYVSRNDLFSLTEQCDQITGIKYVMNAFREEVLEIFGAKSCVSKIVMKYTNRWT